MNDSIYIRVGTTYYKMVHIPTISGQFNDVIVPWTMEAIPQDYGKSFIGAIEKYDGFTCIPSHTNFQQTCHGFYNLYAALPHKPSKGAINYTLRFLEHIFGKQLELGLDYLQLLYTKPIQVLPILCLVSKERSTGKTTFLKWLKTMFDNNMTYLTNDSFSSQFNADWANKLLICIDEVLFNKEELTERIKYLSTTNINKLEAKVKDKREVEFFGKFILCSNNEDNFIKIDTNETRFWVLKVPPLQNEETKFLEFLKQEIPAFLFYLKFRDISCPNRTRMWFSAEQIRTHALVNLMQNNRNRVEKELCSILWSALETLELEAIHVCPLDALQWMNRSRLKTDLTQLRQILKRDWKLVNKKNSMVYRKLMIWQDGGMGQTDAKGRYYTISKDFLTQRFGEN
ncbi:primase-helicase family protein [Maribacter litoralis]|uniref:primase-helicase family protein n=1 Tax=Maribacter litoralis TaxID=2059726 RepID=UPI003F5CE7F4